MKTSTILFGGMVAMAFLKKKPIGEEEDALDVIDDNANPCDGGCGEYGYCEFGVCACGKGWTGVSCQIPPFNPEEPPIITTE